MTRYEECLRHLQHYVDRLRTAPGLNPSAIENLVRAHVEQPAYDVTFRDQLVRDVLASGYACKPSPVKEPRRKVVRKYRIVR